MIHIKNAVNKISKKLQNDFLLNFHYLDPRDVIFGLFEILNFEDFYL